ncbi:matrixin family metalloprotease [Flavobacterium sp. NRK F10]|uniref:matrixin family metalloprotease n=1 Tax=Flavobacterium sp. NRK F10 TaxID=2954931 RepID=UPI002091C074|nr:matrixin family metalloprotease [Flavobacterium sp. NRK F10]MCO6173584.1 matrixin family metalloprotease [Flavobacterium sp. NRK F10]
MKEIYFLGLICSVMLLLFLGCTNKIDSNTVVLLKQYKGLPKAELDTAKLCLEKFYGVNVHINENQELYKEAFVLIKSPRYRADSIIRFQKKDLKDSIQYVLGLTNKDISTTKRDKDGNIKKPVYKYEDWGIMGLAYCPGNSCIISTFRIQSPNERIYFNRFKKIIVHEFGHNLGLPHCNDKKCVMTDAVESIKTIDNADLALCEKCKRELR